MDFSIHSTSFSDGGEIPVRYTCEGEDISPELHWSDPPAGTKSFALIVDDPDAPDPAHPKVEFVHWVAYDIPADVREIKEGVLPRSNLFCGGFSGTSDFKHYGYGRPCPPVGRHRYFFKLYALDTKLSGGAGKSKGELLREMKGHILGEAVLLGAYEKVH